MSWTQALRKGRYALICLALGMTTLAYGNTDSEAELIQRGEYLARAGDCMACHTAPDGKPFAGGLEIATPIGKIYSTNITPSWQDGIGDYTLEQFAQAVREGRKPFGIYLYPAMPYPAYAKLSDDDIAALYAYFMNAVEPVDEPAPVTELPAPFNHRKLMALWNRLFLDTEPFTPDPAKSAEYNRGAYLAEALGHCGTCHTPRNLLMGEKRDRALAGNSLGTWYAPNITSDVNSGIGGWSIDELTAYMKTGSAPGKAQAVGPMAEVVEHSLSHLSDQDLHALTVWLKEVPAVHNAADTQPPYAWGAPAKDNAQATEASGAEASAADPGEMNGAQLYNAYCSGCHQTDGTGRSQANIPGLVNTTILGRINTDNLVMVMLNGISDAHGGMNMPAFGETLSNKQIATLGDYVMTQFGHAAGEVDAERVAELRQGGATPPQVKYAPYIIGACGVIGFLLLMTFFWWILPPYRKRH
ncbi:cytochrome c [Phytohalomonas tamaricis]|uniref:cytochrome c n=1 Tax=Phytohalomonas tamaricis TaxID=2081032 RepID=UPI000D0B3577|nr:cytochrome c [Phytohalomonas tamaricis]